MNAQATLVTADRLQALLARGAVLVVDCRCDLADAEGGARAHRAGHVPGAVNLPHGRINERNLADFPPDALFVVYCNGPHCNGADRAALNLARLGRKVKKMIGGVTGWEDEGFSLEPADNV